MNWKIGEQVFDIPLDIIARKYHYIIGVDTYDETNSAYCLIRREMGDPYTVEVLLAKRMPNTKKFQEEIDNLAKYFKGIKIWNDEIKKFEEL